MLDIAIIGGGPAGLSAGLYAARGGAGVTLFEQMFIGGQAATTERIENYPGFDEGIDGGELCMKMQSQAARFGLNTRYDPVVELELDGAIKKLRLPKETVEARMVILAMGASPKKPDLARIDEFTGKGISYCATCDGAFFKGRDVAIVGGGDTALSDALYLSKLASKVYVIHRRDELRAAKTLQESVFSMPNVEIVWSSIIKELCGESRLDKLKLENVATKKTGELDVAALFVAIGTEPKTELVKDMLRLSPTGAIATDENMQTSIPGVYAVGDIRDTPLRQVITAAADGAVAAAHALLSR